jgi:glycosyltransferase involved in cell wall biosynthesis
MAKTVSEPMTFFSVVIPTLNRPALLQEALRSIAAQSHKDWEVIVVDDGSSPPVSSEAVREIVGTRHRVIRHSMPTGVPTSKNAGAHASRGEFIHFLDDDDLLEPYALERVRDIYEANQGLDCVFLNVRPFGARERVVQVNQQRALEKYLKLSHSVAVDGVAYFGADAFAALLHTVPIALQRPVFRRGLWNILGGMLEGTMFSEPEWTIRAVTLCRMALVLEPLSRWRVDGQNFASVPQAREESTEALVFGYKSLAHVFQRQSEAYRRRAVMVQRRLVKAHLNQAYYHFEDGDRRRASEVLFYALLRFPRWSLIRLLLRMYFWPRPARPN